MGVGAEVELKIEVPRLKLAKGTIGVVEADKGNGHLEVYFHGVKASLICLVEWLEPKKAEVGP